MHTREHRAVMGAVSNTSSRGQRAVDRSVSGERAESGNQRAKREQRSLKALGIDNILGFDWLASPTSEAMITALEVFYALGVLDEDAKLTSPIGFQVSKIPLALRLPKETTSGQSLGLQKETISGQTFGYGKLKPRLCA
ncbi:hypothetical protein Syun_007690 [Stephania yunnanensis]|uniref:Uncharacterized protein n=1 Tax=Stephania yunnanensis TaxID=152371 RepID=A0AAP0Q0H5_9MAGN